MCGLAGAAGPITAEDVHLVETMTGRLRHRGPDSGAVKVFEGAVLGHRRLRIIDLHPSADQPMTEEHGRYWIVFNGEIYNFPELRARLEAAGHRFASHSDTEVIVHLVEEHGEDFAEHLRGMFAIAVWDSDERTLLLVRDRLGIKPLYYQVNGDRLLFSSEARALPGAGGLLDEYSVAAYLALGWVPGPRTIYRGIHELPPGHCLRWRNGSQEIRRWWTVPVAAGREKTLDDLGAALEDSVSRHLVADVPVGVFLSAGLDSAVIATLAAQADADTTAYTVAFDEAPDETEGAKALASRLGLPQTVVHVTGDDVLGSIGRVVASMDQPTVDGVNSWVVSRGARDCGAVVALSGLGGDELFAGYSTFRHVPRIAGLLDRAAPLSGFLRAAPSLALGLSRRTSHTRMGRVLEAARAPGPAAAYAAVRGTMSFQEVEKLRGGWGRDLRRRLPIHEGDGPWSVTGLELTNYLPNQLLRDTDAMSMAHSLEVRVPLLDDEVVSTAMALSATDGLRGKELLAAAVGPELLDIARAPKRTFTLPFDAWLRGTLRDWSADMLRTLGEAGLGFDRHQLDRHFQDFHVGYVNWRSLWSLSVLGAWTSQRSDRPSHWI